MEVPSGSIYFWMYSMGLRQESLVKIEAAVLSAGKTIREKDYQNYWNGYYNSDLYHGQRSNDIWVINKRKVKQEPEFFTYNYCEYPFHPYNNLPEISNRWVPCNEKNKPMIKWGNGCMSLADAVAYPGQKYLAENLKGTRTIVIDCDGDHEEPWDHETMAFLWHYAHMTHCIIKPHSQWDGWCYTGAIPPSFHLTFKVDRIIPTMHFPYAHIDIAGNRRNQLRYWKTKKWNGVEPIMMTDAIWSELVQYIKYRKEKADA